MSDHPIFVPFEGEHLAAVVTVPEEPPRGLAVLLQGLGAPRSHRYGLWTRTARGLADRGIASVRMDYPEVGDSTGALPLAMNDPPLREVRRVIDVALDALGLQTFAIAGNCLGAKTGLALAALDPACVSVGCIIPGSPKSVLRGEGRTAPHRAARRLSKRAPRLGKLGRQMLQSHRIKPRLNFVPEVAEALETARILFLYLGQEEASMRLEGAVAGLPTTGDGTPRAEVRLIPAGITSGMRLDLDIQPLVIDAIVGWIDETLPGGSSSRLRTKERSTDALEQPA